jgi:hypothetical protein
MSASQENDRHPRGVSDVSYRSKFLLLVILGVTVVTVAIRLAIATAT